MSKATSGTGRYLRRSARVLVTDAEGLCLLFRFTAGTIPPFWCTPGGECGPGEAFADAARRELLEETGMAGTPRPLDLVIEYDYTTPDGIDAHALEHWFHFRAESRIIDTSGHTDLERECMVTHRWFTRAELTGWHETVYPATIAHLVDQVCQASAA